MSAKTDKRVNLPAWRQHGIKSRLWTWLKFPKIRNLKSEIWFPHSGVMLGNAYGFPACCPRRPRNSRNSPLRFPLKAEATM